MRFRAFFSGGLLALFVVAGTAIASARTETSVSPDGTRIARTLTALDGAAGQPAAQEATPVFEAAGQNTYLWLDRNHQNAVAENVAISGDGSYGVAGWWLNNMRTALYRIYDDNLPEWVRPMPAVQFTIPVDADYAGDRFTSTGRNDSLYVFTAAGPSPLHAHWYTPPFLGYRDGVSDTGNTYAGAGGNPSGSGGEVRVYDGTGALRFIVPMPAPPEGISVSADGLVVASNVRSFVKVWDALSGALRDSIAIPGETQVPAVLSGDGSYLVTGGFYKIVRLYQWNGTEYAPLWAYNIPGATWVTALAISDDGSTIAAGAWTNGTPMAGKVVLFDRSSSTPLWTDSSYGDWASAVALTADGSRLAAGSWGRSGASFGNVVSVYDRASSTPIHGIGDDGVAGVGSCMSLDISKDGNYVLAGGKAIHAREFGSGGWVMALTLLDPAGAAENAQGPASRDPMRLVATPNPVFGGDVRVAATGADPGGIGALRILAADGREVRTLAAPGDADAWLWDRRDGTGREVAPGVYFVRGGAHGGAGEPLRIVLLR